MKSNQQLKEDYLPHCNWREFLKYTGPNGTEPTRQEVEALDHYFQHFVPPGPCIKCQCKQDGFLGRFKFGMQNGEGQCMTGGCNWPARAFHRNVGPIKELQLILQYHPSVVTWDVKWQD